MKESNINRLTEIGKTVASKHTAAAAVTTVNKSGVKPFAPNHHLPLFTNKQTFFSKVDKENNQCYSAISAKASKTQKIDEKCSPFTFYTPQ